VRRLKLALYSTTIVFSLAVIGMGVVFVPELMRANEEVKNLGAFIFDFQREPSQIYSRDDKLLFQVSTQYRSEYKTLDEIPKVMRDAIIAAEDRRFYQHQGVDYIAMVRAASHLLREGRATQGGSTLTMQLAKQLHSKGEKTFKRKIRDIALAITMERRWTKRQIHEQYLNQVYFGSAAWGVQAASEIYFNKKNIEDLTLSEAAMLARCVRRPSQDNPFANLDRAISLRNDVLNIMLGEGMITQDEFEKAREEEPKLNPSPPKTSARLFGAPFFVDYVLETIRKEFPDIDVLEGGYVIHTTLDWDLQRKTEAELRKLIEANRSRKVTTGGFLLMDADGQILSMAGGVDYNKNQFNAMANGLRQPGSAFKPFVYGTAMTLGRLRITDQVSNVPIKHWDEGSQTFWEPKNAGRGYSGRSYPLRTAFALSINLPAIHTIFDVGPATVAQYSQQAFGFTSRIEPVPSLALGVSEVYPVELAQAYSVFMLRGDRATPYPIVRIRRDHELIKEYHPRIVRNVFDPRVANDIDDLLRHVVTNGTARIAQRVPNARGKTGTTNSNKDAWFCGYADGLVGIGWVANEVKREGRPATYLPMQSGVYGGTVTVQMWTAILEAAHKKYGQQLAAKLQDRYRQSGFAAMEPEVVAVERERVPPSTPVDPAVQPDPVVVPPIDEGVIITRGDEPPRAPVVIDPAPPARRPDGGVPPVTNPGTTNPGTTNPGTTNPPATTPPGNAPPGNAPPGNPPPRRQDPPAEEFVQADVCADSRLRATVYCPETVSRLFRKGREPSRACNLHGSH
jgi:penicillin-binding protein 1A